MNDANAIPAPGNLDQLFGLAGRTAIVTGASAGLGERFSRVLAGAGAQVVAVARRTERLDRLAGEVEGVIPCAADVTEVGDLERVVELSLERCGQIDVLVNNAGIGGEAKAVDEPVEDFRRVVDVDLNAVFALSQLVGRQMLERGSGSIVNIASIYGVVAGAPIGTASYCAAKGGLISLTRDLAIQWARGGVRVNALAPGQFATEMTGDLWETEGAQRFLATHHPLRRIGQPHELDAALLLLAGDGASFITGQVLNVDGGWTAR